MNYQHPLVQMQIKKILSDDFQLCQNRRGVRKGSGDLLVELYCDLIDILKVRLTIEIGAHEASFSKKIKSKSNDAICYAYEANPYVYKKHQKELLSLGIEYQNCAISSVAGEIKLMIPATRGEKTINNTNPISSIYKRGQPSFTYEEVIVQSQRIDGLFSKPEKSAVWIDVEGAQYEVLKSFGLFMKNVQLIYIEIETNHVWDGQCAERDIYDMLGQLGFVEIMRDGLANGQYNTVFAYHSLINTVELEGIVGVYTKKLNSL